MEEQGPREIPGPVIVAGCIALVFVFECLAMACGIGIHLWLGG